MHRDCQLRQLSDSKKRSESQRAITRPLGHPKTTMYADNQAADRRAISKAVIIEAPVSD